MQQKTKLATMIALLLLVALAYSTKLNLALPEQYGPRIDKLRFMVIRSPDAQLVAMLYCDVDVVTDLIRPVDVETLYDAGFSIQYTRGFHISHVGFNLRKPVLDDVNFRHALFHGYNQESIMASIYRYIVTPINSLVPPAQDIWMNPSVPEHPYNPGDPGASTVYPEDHSLCGILRYGGYTYHGTGYGDLTAYWTDPEDNPLPDMDFYTPTYEVAPTEAEHGARIIAEWHKCGLNNINHEPMDFNTYTSLVFAHADFDMYMMFWDLDRFPDHLYDMCHSSQDCAAYPWRYNAPGINDPELDEQVEKVKCGLNYEEKVSAAREAQRMLYDPNCSLCAFSYMQLYSRNYFDAFKPGLRGFVNSPGYGSDNMFTYLNLNWTQGHTNERMEDGKSTVVWCLGDEPGSFNPCAINPRLDRAHASWAILGRLSDPLITANPFTLQDDPWIAYDWQVTETPEGPGAMNVTFWLRDDVEWQCGKPYTAEDAKFNWLFLRDNEIPRSASTWKHIIDVDIVESGEPNGGGVVTVILNVTSQFVLYDLAGTAALLPPPVWSWLDGKLVDEILAYDPSSNTTTPAGAGPRFGTPDCPTQLYGTGPFVFQFYDPWSMYGNMLANRYYFKTTEEIQTYCARESPVAFFTYDPYSPVVGETMSFDASASYDPNGTIESYKWDFGDSSFETDTDPFITHVYTAADTYAVNLTVTDNDGYTHSITKSITIGLVPDSNPPTTTISLSGVEGNNGWFTSDVTVTLSASDDITGVEETEYSFDNTTWTTYTAPFIISNEGSTTVYYRSKDKATPPNVEMIKTRTIKIDKTIPSANAGTDQTVVEDTLVTFNGSASDKNGIESYTWTFTDLTPQTLNGKKPTYYFTNAGTYIVKLIVEDGAGNTATDTVTITVLLDTDGDKTPDTTDLDDDNDSVNDDEDAFPLDPSESVDTDEDGIGNNADTDDDNDEVPDIDDAFPLDASESLDTDADGVGNNADTDDDNDGVLDVDDAFPLDPAESVDTDNDGVGNNADTDDDNDEIPDTWELDNEMDPLNPDDAALDPDGDGLTNLQEYQEGTNPNVSDDEIPPLWIAGVIATVIGIAIVALLWRRRK